MLRLVLLLILLLLVVRFLFLLARRVRDILRAGAPPRSGTAAVPLVPCRRCGVHVPLPRALAERDGAYLCRSCALR